MTNTYGCFDYVIVGSGAGGSAIFYELAQLGKDVLMIEEGPDLRDKTPNHNNEIAQSFIEKYRNGGLTPVFGNPSFTFSEGRLLGGSTEVNGALFWRTPKRVIEDWVINYGLTKMNFLDEHFEFYEKELMMSVVEGKFASDQNVVSQKIRSACSKLNWKVESARRIAPNCLGINQCASGCPNKAKNTMSGTLISRSEILGGKVRTDFKVKKFEYKNEKVTSLVGRNTVNGKIEKIDCKNLILSAGAIGSPQILHRSSNSLLSRNQIGFHLNSKIICEYPDEVHSRKGTIFTEQVQEFLDDGFVFMTSNFQPEYLALNLGLLDSAEIKRIYENIERFAIVTVQVRPFSYGTQLHHLDNSSLYFALNNNDVALMRESMARTIEALFESGVKRVLLPFTDIFVENIQEAKSAILNSSIKSWQFGSVHAMSSLPMRIENSRKNVNQGGKLSRFKNLWVCDASILPTTIGESPQETIMAIVRSLANEIANSK